MVNRAVLKINEKLWAQFCLIFPMIIIDKYCTNTAIKSKSDHVKESYHRIPKSTKVISYEWDMGMWDFGTLRHVVSSYWNYIELHWVELAGWVLWFVSIVLNCVFLLSCPNCISCLYLRWFCIALKQSQPKRSFNR